MALLTDRVKFLLLYSHFRDISDVKLNERSNDDAAFQFNYTAILVCDLDLFGHHDDGYVISQINSPANMPRLLFLVVHRRERDM